MDESKHGNYSLIKDDHFLLILKDDNLFEIKITASSGFESYLNSGMINPVSTEL